MPVKVLRIIARMNVGGPAVEITELLRGLHPSSFDQRLLTGFCAPDEADYLQTQAPDVPVTRISGLGRSIRPGDDVRVLGRLVSEIRAFRPDVIHTHTAKAGVLGRVAARMAGGGAQVIHTHHGHLLHGYFGPMKTRALIQAERSLSRITDTLVTVGAQVRDDLLGAGIGRAEQYRVVYSGVRLAQLPAREQARAELGLALDRPVVSMIGRLTRIKRPDRFLKTATSVLRTNPDTQFLVAGWGDEGEQLRASASGLPISVLGWRDDLERLLAATDIVLLTSDNEGTPLSLVQAGLAGIPSVATDVGSVHEVIERDVTGLLAPADPEALAGQLRRLLDDAGLRAQLGEAARSFAARRFSPASFLQAHRDLYGGR